MRNEIPKKVRKREDKGLFLMDQTFNSKDTVVKTSKRGKALYN